MNGCERPTMMNTNTMSDAVRPRGAQDSSPKCGSSALPQIRRAAIRTDVDAGGNRCRRDFERGSRRAERRPSSLVRSSVSSGSGPPLVARRPRQQRASARTRSSPARRRRRDPPRQCVNPASSNRCGSTPSTHQDRSRAQRRSSMSSGGLSSTRPRNHVAARCPATAAPRPMFGQRLCTCFSVRRGRRSSRRSPSRTWGLSSGALVVSACRPRAPTFMYRRRFVLRAVPPSPGPTATHDGRRLVGKRVQTRLLDR